MKKDIMPLVALVLSLTLVVVLLGALYGITRAFAEPTATPRMRESTAFGVEAEGGIVLITEDGHVWATNHCVKAGTLYTVTFNTADTEAVEDDTIVSLTANE